MGKFTIEIDEHHALVLHNNSLQDALTKRNKQIEVLEARLEAGEGSEYVTKAYEKGKREGWIACSNQLTNATMNAARALSEIRKEAFEAYLHQERVSQDAGDSNG